MTTLLVLSLIPALPVSAQMLDSATCAQLVERIASGDITANRAYNAACCMARQDQVDSAFAYLNLAFTQGYKDIEWMTEDADLWSMHRDPRWAEALAACSLVVEQYLQTVNVELYRMFQSDQSDRSSGEIDWSLVSERDEQRRSRALEMIADDELSTSDDYVHAAFIFQHGYDSSDYRLANDLAMKAVLLDSTNLTARWIAAASKDRHLQSLGLPQWYGTQRRLIDGIWTIEPIDTTKVTDEERAWWGVRSLAESRHRAEEMNR